MQVRYGERTKYGIYVVAGTVLSCLGSNHNTDAKAIHPTTIILGSDSDTRLRVTDVRYARFTYCIGSLEIVER